MRINRKNCTAIIIFDYSVTFNSINYKCIAILLQDVASTERISADLLLFSINEAVDEDHVALE